MHTNQPNQPLKKMSCAILIALSSQYAVAQQTPGLDDSAESDFADIEVVEVKGQKISRSLQDTKESVSVITAEMLRQMPVLEVKDVFDLTPNAFNLAGGESFGLRGVSQNSASTGGGGGDLGVLFIDGVSYTGFASRFNSKDVWDIEQIEILRGPQSTNVGRNALVGAVVISTNRPEIGENYGEVRLDAGNYGRRAFNGTANIAVSENSAFRLTGQYWENEGFINNVTLNDDEFDARKNTNVRAQYKVEFSDQLSANLLVGYVDTERGNDIYRSDLQPIDSFTSSANLAASEDYEAVNSALTITYDINDSLTLTSITSFLDGEYFRIDDDDEGPMGGNAFRGRVAEEEVFIQELRLTYNSDKLSGVAGIFYNTVEQINNTTGLANIAPANVGVPAPLLPFYPENLEINVLSPFSQDISNLAFFTEWEYKLSDKWTLSAGVRWDSEDQDVLTNTNNSLAVGSALPDPVAAGALSEQLAPGTGAFVEAGVAQVNGALLGLLAPTNFPEESYDFNAFLPQLGATYQINPTSSVSVFYKQGYRTGGVQVNASGNRSEFDPETLDNYEIAYRSVWLEGDLVFNANAYYGDWTDQQVSVCMDGNIFNCDVENVGESTIYGVEMDARYSVNDDLSIFASVGYAEAEFDEFISGIEGDLSGNNFAFSPDWTASIGGQYYFAEDFYINANINYQDEMFSDVQNTPEFRADSRILVNLRGGYVAEKYSVEVFVTNLTDEFYAIFNGIGIDAGSNLVRAGAPREFGVQVTYRFE